MKVFKWIADSLIRQVVTIDESLFGFVPGRDTADAILFIRQLQEKYFTVGKQIYMAIVDIEGVRPSSSESDLVGNEKACSLGMYCEPRLGNVRECTAQCMGEGLSDEFEGKVGVHQGSVLSPQHCT